MITRTTITLEEVVRRSITIVVERVGPKPSPLSAPKLLAEHARRIGDQAPHLELVRKVA